MPNFFAPEVGLIFYQTLMMIGTVLLLKKYAWKHILAYVKAEEERQQEAEEMALKAKKMAEEAEDNREAILKKSQEECNLLVAHAQSTKKALLSEARYEAQAERKKILQKASKEIARKEAKIVQEVKRKAGTLLIKTAEKLLAMELQAKHKEEKFLSLLLAKTQLHNREEPNSRGEQKV